MDYRRRGWFGRGKTVKTMTTTPSDWKIVSSGVDAAHAPAVRPFHATTRSQRTQIGSQPKRASHPGLGRSLSARIVYSLIIATTLFAFFDMWLLAVHARP
jgi:hypothetical protein